jgi:hypothetical protein
MSIYDQRDKPAYGNFKIEPYYSRNQYILRWWTPDHDRLLAEQITIRQWVWYWNIADVIVKITPSDELETWKKEDPACSQYAWYNILMYFAASRAEELGLTRLIRSPEWKICLLCNQRFVEDSLPLPFIERLGIDRLDFCAPCLRDTVLQGSGDDSVSEQSILKYLQDLAELIGCVPTQNFGEGTADLLDVETSDRVKLLKLFQRKPTIKRVKVVFGSWLNALIQADILEDGTRKTSRGIQTIAKDGHVCLSLGEKTIDEWLYAHGICHEKEPRYPEGNFRADFKVGDIFIEYFGLVGDLGYDAKTKEKIHICEKHGLILVAIYPQDLISQERLKRKLSLFLSSDGVRC